MMRLDTCFTERLKERPHKPLLSDASGAMDCLSALRTVDHLANGLLTAGVSAGDCVGLLLNNSPAFVLSVFAVWRLGGVVVPMSPRQTSESIARIAALLGVCLIVTESSVYAAHNGLIELRVVKVTQATGFGPIFGCNPLQAACIGNTKINRLPNVHFQLSDRCSGAGTSDRGTMRR